MRKSDSFESDSFASNNFESNGFGKDDFGRNDADTNGQMSAERSLQIEALRQHQMRNWWWLSLALWLTIGVVSLWSLRFEFQELNAYFTWAAVRAMLAFNRLPALGLGICFGLTIALLYAESRHILFGLSKSEAQQLTTRLSKIYAQGPSHPQWKIIAPTSATSEK
ncbi:MAG: hypothetical protein AB8B99_12250 [Phormidesmis sp.]